MVYKMAICDDDRADIAYISSIVAKWSSNTHTLINIDTFLSAEEFLFHYTEDKSYHILLLDIEMRQMNGVELAKNIRKSNKEIQIVFITGYMEYISDGYDVEALHYLMKPVKEDKLYDVLLRALKKIRCNERSLLLSLQGQVVRVPLYEIMYLDVQKNYVNIHSNELITIKKTLSEVEKELDDSFFRAGRSYIVNLKFIKKVTKTDIYLKNGETIPLPRGIYKSINEAIINYF